MNDWKVLRRVVLADRHQPTGRTVHRHGTNVLPTPSELRIVQIPGDAGFYLFYCNSEGNELTDTYHETLGGALEQARWEFEVLPDDWEAVSP